MGTRSLYRGKVVGLGFAHPPSCSVKVKERVELYTVAYPGILFGGGGRFTNSVENRRQRERGSGGGSPLVRGSGGSCNLV